jgi:thiamine-monophosphate kinase
MSNEKLTPISDLGEFGLIERLSARFTNHHASTLKGIGDDAAVLDATGKQTVVTTDLLAEGVHFDLSYVPLKHLGYKAVVVNLSDIYAMNAKPKQILVSMALPGKFTVEAADELYEGIAHACAVYGVDLVGGDTTTSKSGLVLSVTAIGEALPEELIYRNTAQVGDLICVSGDLGAAYLGLQILEREKMVWETDPSAEPEIESDYLVKRQLKPEARKDIIDFLGEIMLRPTSMMDLSDGLSSDILHICKQSNVGCLIDEARVPISEDAYNLAIKFNMDPITCALSGGEDYELLFTINPDDESKLIGEESITIIGEITAADQGKTLKTKGGNFHAIKAQGWKHF